MRHCESRSAVRVPGVVLDSTGCPVKPTHRTHKPSGDTEQTDFELRRHDAEERDILGLRRQGRQGDQKPQQINPLIGRKMDDMDKNIAKLIEQLATGSHVEDVYAAITSSSSA